MRRDLYKKVIRFLSYYVFFVGGSSDYYEFLDSVFYSILQNLLSDSLESDLRLQCIIVDVCIYMLNVVRRSITKIRIEKKGMFNSNIEMVLQAENRVTAEQCRAFRIKMTSSDNLDLYVNHFRDFINEIKNASEGEECRGER